MAKYNKDNPLRVCTLCSGYDSQCLALKYLQDKQMKSVNQNKPKHPLAELAKHQKPLDSDISEWVDKHFNELI